MRYAVCGRRGIVVMSECTHEEQNGCFPIEPSAFLAKLVVFALECLQPGKDWAVGACRGLPVRETYSGILAMQLRCSCKYGDGAACKCRFTFHLFSIKYWSTIRCILNRPAKGNCLELESDGEVNNREGKETPRAFQWNSLLGPPKAKHSIKLSQI